MKKKDWKAVRLNKDGTVDDVAITSDLFRLEQMDDDVWWACAYNGKKRTAFNIFRKGKKVICEVIEDEIGCIDDTQREKLPKIFE